MRNDNDNKKKLFLKQIKAELKSRLSPESAEQAILFSDIFFRRVPYAGLGQESPQVAAAMLVSQLDFLQLREQGGVLIRVFNPGHDRDGWECQHTVVELANDDMPFLVDTSSMVMQELNLGVHLIVHPVLNVERDTEGRL
ncbi:MAG: NAD-glutamate dehydrogenase, partial [Gammaproteobacteria bacterium]|nr:NAD-glutamate dehydrogenase [Gammaproteobacteria bacterium]